MQTIAVLLKLYPIKRLAALLQEPEFVLSLFSTDYMQRRYNDNALYHIAQRVPAIFKSKC